MRVRTCVLLTTLVLLSLSLAAALIGIYVSYDAVHATELAYIQWLHGASYAQSSIVAFHNFEFFVSPLFYVILFCLSYNYTSPERALRWMTFLILNALSAYVMKILWHEPRPYWVDKAAYVPAVGVEAIDELRPCSWDFGQPSGHAQTFTAVFFLIGDAWRNGWGSACCGGVGGSGDAVAAAVAAAAGGVGDASGDGAASSAAARGSAAQRLMRHVAFALLALGAFTLWVVLMVSRIYLAEHFAYQVATGALLGLAELCAYSLFAGALQRRALRWLQQSVRAQLLRWSCVSLALVTPAAAAYVIIGVTYTPPPTWWQTFGQLCDGAYPQFATGFSEVSASIMLVSALMSGGAFVSTWHWFVHDRPNAGRHWWVRPSWWRRTLRLVVLGVPPTLAYWLIGLAIPGDAHVALVLVVRQVLRAVVCCAWLFFGAPYVAWRWSVLNPPRAVIDQRQDRRSRKAARRRRGERGGRNVPDGVPVGEIDH